jgi:hypothetical protein
VGNNDLIFADIRWMAYVPALKWNFYLKLATESILELSPQTAPDQAVLWSKDEYENNVPSGTFLGSLPP